MTRHIRLDPSAAALDCDAFARLLADWLEGDLRPSLRAAADRHRDECAECAALVASLDDLRTEAAALGPIEPPRDLWGGIERRIAARVVELPVTHAHRAGGAGHRAGPSWLRGAWAAAAAALLVAAVGGAGYLAARGGTAAAPQRAAAPVAMQGVAVPAPDAPTVRDAASPPRLVASATIGAPTRTPSAARAPDAPRATPAAPPSPLDAEIATLRRTLEARRAALDTATVRVLEANLAILDGAIRESRAALVEEPTSQLLHEQLNHALDAKLELMRTAVILSGDD